MEASFLDLPVTTEPPATRESRDLGVQLSPVELGWVGLTDLLLEIELPGVWWRSRELPLADEDLLLPAESCSVCVATSLTAFSCRKSAIDVPTQTQLVFTSFSRCFRSSLALSMILCRLRASRW